MAGSLIPSNQKNKGILGSKKDEADRLGRRTALVGASTVLGASLLTFGFGWTLIGPLAGIAGLGYTAHQAWQWIQYRAKWGLRF